MRVETLECIWYNSNVLEDGALELAKYIITHKTNYVGKNLAHIADALSKGDLRFFFVEEPCNVWFATTITKDGQTGIKELNILGLYGKGVFKYKKEILSLWIEMAKYNDCQFIWTQTSEKAVARILKSVKFLPLTETFVFSVPLGRKQ